MPMTPLKANHIESGRMMQILDTTIAKVGREVISSYNAGDAKQPSGKIHLIISIEKDSAIIDDYRTTFQISYSLPKISGAARCTAQGGVLSCNHRGADHENPKQESLLEQMKEETYND